MKKKIVLITIALVVIGIGIFLQGDKLFMVNSAKGVTFSSTLGQTKVEAHPKRIIAVDYAALDILDYLNVDVIGVAKQTLPTYLKKYTEKKYTDIGTLRELNIEKIAAAKPDVIFISSRQKDYYDQLKQIAPTVYLEIKNDRYFEDSAANALKIGELFGKEKAVEEKMNENKMRAEKIQEKVGKSQANDALILMVNEGAISVYGSTSRYGFIYQNLGFVPNDNNIQESTHGQLINYEYLLKQNPNYLIILDRNVAVGNSSGVNDFLANDLVKQLKAVQDEQTIILNAQAWYLVAGGLTATELMIDDIEQAVIKN